MDALEVPTQDAANSAKPVGAIGEKTTPPIADVAAPVAAKQVEPGAEEDAGLEEAEPARSDGEEFEDLTEEDVADRAEEQTEQKEQTEEHTEEQYSIQYTIYSIQY